MTPIPTWDIRPQLILSIGVVGGVVAVVFTALSAVLCDIFGRRRIIMVGFAAGVPWSFAVIPLLDTGQAVWFAVAIAVFLDAIAGTAYGPMASFVPENLRHPLPLQRRWAVSEPCGVDRWRSATSDRRAADGNLGRPGDRHDDGSHGASELRQYLPAARNQGRHLAHGRSLWCCGPSMNAKPPRCDAR